MKYDEDLLNDINIETVLYADAYSLKKVKTERSKKNYLKTVYNDLVRSQINFPEIASNIGKVLCFRSLERDDYAVLFNDIIGTIEDEKVVLENFSVQTERLELSASIALSINHALSEKIKEKDAITKACLFVRLIKYCSILQQVIHFKPKKVVLFADMQPVENLISQYFRIRKIPTVTIQHGLYVDYENHDTVNRINYEHFCSDYFLAWGSCSEALIKKYHSQSNVIVCGKPRIYSANNVDGKTIIDRFIYVILDQKIFDLENKMMLREVIAAAEELGFRVNVKFHPQNNKDNYFNEFPTILEGLDIGSAAFVVGHTSSLLYEALVLGFKALKYHSNAPSLPTNKELTFSDSRELVNKYNELNMLNFCGSNYISDIGEDSLRKYHEFFNNQF